MTLNILYIAYSLLPVTDESAGGAEQMLWTLEREMHARGHRTAVAACEGSRVEGKLLATGRSPQRPDNFEDRETEHNCRIVEHVAMQGISQYDMVHDKSGSFWRNAAAIDAPVLATLHLPRSFYRPELFVDLAPNIYFNCVSEAQAQSYADLPHFHGVVKNGIAVDRFPFTADKDEYLLWMGRICEEKGTHVAIEVAAKTGLPLVIAGQVYPFSYHQRYYESFVRPHLGANGSQVRFIEAPLFEQKVELLRHAHAVLVPSLCDETSSLVSLEAMACGTPVIGFRRGAIPEVVSDGATGFVVKTSDEMADAVANVSRIDARACRERVETHYSARRMADEYATLYERVVARRDELRHA